MWIEYDIDMNSGETRLARLCAEACFVRTTVVVRPSVQREQRHNITSNQHRAFSSLAITQQAHARTHQNITNTSTLFAVVRRETKIRCAVRP